MPSFTASGAKFYIGGPLDGPAVTGASFTGQTWVEINPIETLGTFGDTATEVDGTHLGLGRVVTRKGLRSAGRMEVVAQLDYSDAGQLALLAAEASNHDYAFRVVFNDAPPGGTPSERLFVAMVMSAQEEAGDGSALMKLNATIAINSNILRIHAEEA